MIRRCRLHRACLAGAALAMAALGPAGSAFGSRDEELFVRSEDLHTVLFGSADVGRSSFLLAGAKRTITGPLDRSGFVLLETSGVGFTRERYDPTPGFGVTRVTSETASLLGYQWAAAGLYTAIYAGPELHQEELSVAAAARRVSKPRIGGRLQAEVWANPTPATLFTATAVAGSTRGSLYGRVSAGYRVWRNLFAGPEASFYVTDTYREGKVGLHLTGLDVGIVHMRVSGGLQFEDDRRSTSPYFGLTSWIRL